MFQRIVLRYARLTDALPFLTPARVVMKCLSNASQRGTTTSARTSAGEILTRNVLQSTIAAPFAEHVAHTNASVNGEDADFGCDELVLAIFKL